MPLTLAEVASRIGARLIGDPAATVCGLGALADAKPGELTHLSSAAYRRHLTTTSATAVILAEADAPNCPTNALVAAHPYHAYAVASTLFETRPCPVPGVHPNATVHPRARLSAGVAIGPSATVEADVELGEGVEVGAGAFVGRGAVVGAGTVIMPNATLCHGVHLGCRCVIHSGAVIGADGFGFAPDGAGRLQAIAQLGGVRIGNDVSVGALTAIDRGAIRDTVIGDGVKIDNQVQVGHNCEIGAHSVLCGQVGLVGSTRIGRHCMLGGGVGVGGDGPVEICDGVMVTATTHVTSSITSPGLYAGGTLHAPARSWKRNALRFAKLDGLAQRLARLERKVAAGKGRDECGGLEGAGRD